jgi:hypothetical protein
MDEEKVAAEGESPAPATLDSVIPEEYAGRAYLSDLRPMELGPGGYKALFAKLDNAQKLIGKKAGVPAADAPDAEWDEFHSRLRPPSPEGYEISLPDGASDEDKKAQEEFRKMFYEAGLSPRMAKALVGKLDAFTAAKTEADAALKAKEEAEFAEMTAKAFGGDNAKVMAQAQEMLSRFTPDNLKPYLSKVPNDGLVVLAGVMKKVKETFMKEDGSADGGTADMRTTDPKALREEARTLMAKPEYRDAFHKDHEAVVARVKEIYARIS